MIVLDLGLPDMSGIEVLAGLRGWLSAPVVVLSARTDSSEKVEALDAGADDYVTKPFGMDEFLARLRAAVRRGAAASETDEPVVETDSFTVDLAAKKVTRNGAEVHLTPTEWGMLEMLVRNRGKLVGREELLKEVWGPCVRQGDALSAGVPGAVAPQARGRSVASAASADRSRDGLPLRAVTRPGPGGQIWRGRPAPGGAAAPIMAACTSASTTPSARATDSA